VLTSLDGTGGAVYEPFCGTGTTIIAAEQLGRRCLAIELVPQYVDVAVRRWQEFTGRRAVLERTGDSPVPQGEMQ
jgi:DNA modification methylase